MELTRIGEVRRLLAAYGLRPRKSRGQNFLVAAGVLDKILEAAEIRAGDLVVEIGPGLGALTRRLVEDGARVVAVELDAGLLLVLRDVLSDYADRVRLIQADALEVDYEALLKTVVGRQSPEVGPAEGMRDVPFKVVANLPYYITSPFIAGFLEAGYGFERMVLMVQRETAERMVAEPGTKAYGALTVLVCYHTRAEVFRRVSRHCFYPSPAVDSAIIRLFKREQPAVSVLRPDLYFRIVRAAFGQRRKMLPNALDHCISGLDRKAWTRLIRDVGLDPQARGETLTPEEFGIIADACARMGFDPPAVV